MPDGPGRVFYGRSGLNIEDFFLTGTPPGPVERTLLTTGILETVMISRHQGGARIETPHLDIAYQGGLRLRRPAAPRPGAASQLAVPLPEPGSTPAAVPIPIGRDGTTRAGSQ